MVAMAGAGWGFYVCMCMCGCERCVVKEVRMIVNTIINSLATSSLVIDVINGSTHIKLISQGVVDHKFHKPACDVSINPQAAPNNSRSLSSEILLFTQKLNDVILDISDTLSAL
jgi:hypothetical protein